MRQLGICDNKVKILINRVCLTLLVWGLVLGFAAIPVQAAAQAVSYSLSPATGAYQPGATVSVELSIISTQSFAGVSVRVAPTNMTYASFNTANSPAFILVDYHEDVRDIVVICQNNNCPAGTYKIGTLHFTAGQTGTMGLAITPVETADPNLQPIGADGTNSSYNITPNAPPASSAQLKTPPKSTYTVPRANTGGTIVPVEVDEETRTEQQNEALLQLTADGITQGGKQSKKSNVVSYIIIGIAIGIIISVLTFGMFMLIARRRARGYITGNTMQFPQSSENTGQIIQPPPENNLNL